MSERFMDYGKIIIKEIVEQVLDEFSQGVMENTWDEDGSKYLVDDDDLRGIINGILERHNLK